VVQLLAIVHPVNSNDLFGPFISWSFPSAKQTIKTESICYSLQRRRREPFLSEAIREDVGCEWLWKQGASLSVRFVLYCAVASTVWTGRLGDEEPP